MRTLKEIGKYLERCINVKDEKKFKSELPQLMRESAKLRKNYYHYTDLNAVSKMFGQEVGYLRFTKLTSLRLNDLHESTCKGCWAERDRLFIACFTYSGVENMAMWALYGGKDMKKKTRVKFPYALLCSMKEHRIYRECGSGRYEELEDNIWRKCEVYFTEVCYVKGIGSDLKGIYYSDKYFPTPDYCSCDYDCTEAITGSIKNEVWRYENEVRMIIKVPRNELPDSTEQLYVPLPKGSFKCVEIMTGPQFCCEESRKLLNGLNVCSSSFEGLVNL